MDSKQDSIKVKSNKKRWLIVCIILCIVIGTGYYYYLNHSNSDHQYDDLISEAKEAVNNQNYELAISDYKEAIQLNPTNMKIYIELSDIYVIQEDYGDALLILDSYLQYANSDEKEEITFLTEQYNNLAIKQVIRFYADSLEQYTSDYDYFGLIYLDNDDLPELVLQSTDIEKQNLYLLCKYESNNVVTLQKGQIQGEIQLAYIERGNLFYQKDIGDSINYNLVDFNNQSSSYSIIDYTHSSDQSVLGNVMGKDYTDVDAYSNAVNATKYFNYNNGDITLKEPYLSQKKDAVFYELNDENIQLLFMSNYQQFIS